MTFRGSFGRFALPVLERRGAGLGNELILWAKAFIAGQALNMRVLHPAWGLNPRRYWRYFRTSRLDVPVQLLLRAGLPSIRFSESDYLRHGGEDYATAIGSFSAEQGLTERAPILLEIEGLWSGPGMLAPAREFIRGQLLNTRWTPGNLYEIERRTSSERLRIGVHLRRGDFNQNAGDFQGKFNLAVPMAWYETIMHGLYRIFGKDVVFLIASDASKGELAALTSKLPCVTTLDIPNSDVSDMMALSQCDFLICSISSFSMWAGFLGEMPYAWFEPQLTEHDGLLSIWGHQAAQRQATSPISHASVDFRAATDSGTIRPRGIAIGMDGIIPDEILSELRFRLWSKRRATDLIRYGVVPIGQS
jgi:hypothetical protein